MINNLKPLLNKGDNDGKTPLHLSCYFEHDFTKLLVKQRLLINQKDNNNKTAFYYACYWHNYNAVSSLIKYKDLDIESVDDNENTALHGLVSNIEEYGNHSASIVSYILAKSSYMIYKLNKEKKTAIDIMETDIYRPNFPNQENVESVRCILNNVYSATINKQNDEGNTPLHLLCKYRAECNIVTKLLSDPNILVNVRNEKGRTPFHGACYHCNPCMVNRLNEHPKINIHMVDINGENALHHLLQGYFKHQDNEACKLTIELLLKINPFFVIKENKHGETPLYYITKFNRNNVIPDLHLNGKWRPYISPGTNREVWKFLLTTIQNCHLEALLQIKNYLMQLNVPI